MRSIHQGEEGYYIWFSNRLIRFLYSAVCVLTVITVGLILAFLFSKLIPSEPNSQLIPTSIDSRPVNWDQGGPYVITPDEKFRKFMESTEPRLQ